MPEATQVVPAEALKNEAVDGGEGGDGGQGPVKLKGGDALVPSSNACPA